MNDTASLLALADRMLWITALVAAPILIASLAVGLVVGVIQAATSVNEQTLTFIPKFVLMGLALAVLGHWMINQLVEYTRVLFGRIPSLFS